MYNLYSEEKKISERDKQIKEKKEIISFNEKHKRRTNSLFYNYQKRIKKFMIDVRNIIHIIIIGIIHQNVIDG